MSFPLWFLLVPYAAVLVFSAIFLYFNVFHIIRYGVDDLATRGVALAYVIGFLIVLSASAWILEGFDWMYVPTLQDLLPFSLDRSPIGL